jgi:hypothetical protein
LLNIFHHALIKHGGVKMNLVEIVKVTSSEEGADDRCPFCGHQKIGKEWSIRKDSILEGLKVPFTKFILAVILEVPVNKDDEFLSGEVTRAILEVEGERSKG